MTDGDVKCAQAQDEKDDAVVKTAPTKGADATSLDNKYNHDGPSLVEEKASASAGGGAVSEQSDTREQKIDDQEETMRKIDELVQGNFGDGTKANDVAADATSHKNDDADTAQTVDDTTGNDATVDTPQTVEKLPAEGNDAASNSIRRPTPDSVEAPPLVLEEEVQKEEKSQSVNDPDPKQEQPPDPEPDQKPPPKKPPPANGGSNSLEAGPPATQQHAADDAEVAETAEAANTTQAETEKPKIAWVNEGLQRWEKARQAWLGISDRTDATVPGRKGEESRRPQQNAVQLDVDEIIDIIFMSSARNNNSAPQRFPQNVALPQMVDILQDLWEAEGLDT